MIDSLFSLQRRESPLIISIPHLGARIPADLRSQYTGEALTLADTDWHLNRLYEHAEALDATVIHGTITDVFGEHRGDDLKHFVDSLLREDEVSAKSGRLQLHFCQSSKTYPFSPAAARPQRRACPDWRIAIHVAGSPSSAGPLPLRSCQGADRRAVASRAAYRRRGRLDH